MHTNEHGNRDKKRVSAEALTLSFGGGVIGGETVPDCRHPRSNCRSCDERVSQTSPSSTCTTTSIRSTMPALPTPLSCDSLPVLCPVAYDEATEDLREKSGEYA